MKLLKPVSTIVLSLALFSISGCSASGDVTAEDKEILRDFCLKYQGYTSSTVKRVEESRLEFIDLTPMVSLYKDNESIDALKGAMVDVNTHYSWAEAEVRFELSGGFVDLWESTSMKDAEQIVQSSAGITPPIGVIEVEANLISACSQFTE